MRALPSSRRGKIMVVTLLLIVLGGVAAAAMLSRGTPASTWVAGDADFAQVERGRYLSLLGDCAACHTATSLKPFAGGVVLATPFGNLVAPNITPDPETGIGTMSPGEF